MGDSVLSVLLTFPPHPPPAQFNEADYNVQAKKFQDALSKIPPANLTAGIKGGEDFLEILNPLVNSISYLHVLLAHIYSPRPKGKAPIISEQFAPRSPLWLKMLEFVEQFDPIQIRYCGHEIRTLIEVTSQKAVMEQKPAAAIKPVRSAILRIDPSNATFTSSHRLLPHLCLHARDYAAALPVLDKDIYHFPNMTIKSSEMTADPLSPYLCSAHESSSNFISTCTGLTYKLDYQEHLLYYLWGAMCYMALKDWDRAGLFLEVVIASPNSNVASKIQVDAYKKWVLVSLLRKGSMGSLPKTTNSQAIRIYQALGRPYIGLAEVFKQSLNNEESSTKLVAEAHEGEQIWRDELNLGLVRQVVDAYRYFFIRQLGNTYAALPITEVTDRTSQTTRDHAETGRYLLSLIDSGRLNASIAKPRNDPSSWILRFSEFSGDGPQSPTEQQLHDELTRQMAHVHKLMQHIKEADRKFVLSKEYVAEQKRIRSSKENGTPGFDEAWGGPSEMAFDEDVMAD